MKSQSFQHFTGIALLLLFLCGCSPFVPAENNTPLPTANSKPPTVEKNPKFTPGTTPTPEAYPALQSATTPAPYPAQRPIKPTPFFTQTPEIHWNTDALEFSWPGYDAIPHPEWLDNTTAKLASLMTGSGHDDYTVDISGGKDARAETIQGDPNWKVYSPNRTYVIECKDNFRMMRVKDNSLVSETPVSPPDPSSISCSTFIHWAPDESFAGFLANDLSIFIWESNGAEPAKVFGPLSTRYTNIAWSPDSKKMAFVRSTTRLPDGPPLGTAVILDRDGQFLSEVQVQIVDSAILWWLTNDVLESISRSQTWFYDITSGDLLFSWKDQPTASGNFHQRLRVSPDGRWVFIDQGDQIHDSTTQSNRVIVEKQYALYDIQNKTSIPLLDDPETYLLFAGWNADNSKMYVISRPAESTSKSSPAAPFGLLAFDPKARQFELLFKDAVQISWNSDMSQAFIVFAAQTTEGRLGLAGGLWMPGTQTVTGQINVSNQMVYQDPAQETYFSLYPGPFPIVWSHDDQRMAICDNFGNVKLIHKNGTEQILSTAISGKVWLRWSPDDQHLLVLSDNRAWIVNVLTG